MPRKKIEEEKIEEPRKPQLIFCMAAIDAEATIAESLASVKPYADRIIVVEGRFSDWAYDRKPAPFSTDRTREIAESMADTVIHDVTDRPQHEVRDQYLLGEEGDFYFVIDSDEVLEGNFDKEAVLGGPYDSYGMPLKPGEGLVIRLYRHIGERPRHSLGQLLIDGRGRLMEGTHPGFTMQTGFWLRHLKG
jgi:hypothetical protein